MRQRASSLGLSEGVRRQSITLQKETKRKEKYLLCFNHDHIMKEYHKYHFKCEQRKKPRKITQETQTYLVQKLRNNCLV